MRYIAHSRTPLSILAAAAALSAAAISAAACGGGGPADPSSSASASASGGNVIAGSGAPGGGSGQQSSSSFSVAFARCMRANGITNFPDPNGQPGQLGPGSGFDPNTPQFQAALNGPCVSLAPPGWVGSGKVTR
jgi:hypothetical protein